MLSRRNDLRHEPDARMVEIEVYSTVGASWYELPGMWVQFRQDCRREYLFRRHDDQPEHEVEEHLLVSAHAFGLAVKRSLLASACR